jgi:hypothetical protein
MEMEEEVEVGGLKQRVKLGLKKGRGEGMREGRKEEGSE